MLFPLQSEWVHAVTNEPLVVNTALIDDDTGLEGEIGRWSCCCCVSSAIESP